MSFFFELGAGSHLTPTQLRHVAEYATGLAVSDNRTVTGINDILVGGVDQSNLNRAITTADWDPELLNRARLNLLQQYPNTQWGRRGILALDDTFITKDGRLMPGAGRMYNHTTGHTEWGQQLVTLQYVGPQISYPIDFRQYYQEISDEVRSGQVDFKMKQDLALELVLTALNAGCPAKTVVFDSWYVGSLWLKRLRFMHWIFAMSSQSKSVDMCITLTR